MWKKLKGIKTAIGMGIVIVGTVVSFFDPPLGRTIIEVGTGVGAIGLADKGVTALRTND
jgi:tRNA1(Val) A37 N6-methylase TrmN6